MMNFQAGQRFVQFKDVDSRTIGHVDEKRAPTFTPAFLCMLSPGVIDQNVPHCRGGPGTELGFRPDFDATLLDEAHPKFVDEGGWLEGVISTLRPEQMASDPLEFSVEVRQIAIRGSG